MRAKFASKCRSRASLERGERACSRRSKGVMHRAVSCFVRKLNLVSGTGGGDRAEARSHSRVKAGEAGQSSFTALQTVRGKMHCLPGKVLRIEEADATARSCRPQYTKATAFKLRRRCNERMLGGSDIGCCVLG